MDIIEGHSVTIETDTEGDLMLACSCGAQSDVDSYAIDLADVIGWLVGHTQLPPLSERTT